MEYELEVLNPQSSDELRVTAWFLNSSGERTGLYVYIIEDGVVCNPDTYEQFRAVLFDQIFNNL